MACLSSCSEILLGDSEYRLFRERHALGLVLMGLKSANVESKLPTVALAIFGVIVMLHVWMLLSKPNTPREDIALPHFVQTVQPSQVNEGPSPAFSDVYPPVAALPPYTPFPRKIWQTAKYGPAGLDEMDRAALRTWTKLNQKWRYEAVTQYGAETYVRERFAHRPELVEAFTDLQDPILHADLVRYLVLLGDGGVYSDLDTRALKPINDWIPAEYRRLANVVVGVEYDRLEGTRWMDWTLDLQFATWAILAKPGHALLDLTVQRVIDGLRRLAVKQGTTLAGVQPSFQDVLDTTGPALFTNAVFERLSYTTGTNFTWLNVTDLKIPRLVDDILILPITAFGNGQGHSNAGSPEEDLALVQHLFKGSWKGDHPMVFDEPEQKEEEKIAQQQIEVIEALQKVQEGNEGSEQGTDQAEGDTREVSNEQTISGDDHGSDNEEEIKDEASAHETSQETEHQLIDDRGDELDSRQMSGDLRWSD